MKKLHLFMAATLSAATFSLASCSESDDMPQPVGGFDNEIRFAANTEYSRAGEITTANLSSFNVYAYTGTADTLFMNNVAVSKTGTNVWSYSPVQYWPANETVDFYAFAPASWVGTKGALSPIAYDAYPGTEDIIYAVSANLSGNTGQANAQVIFSFRHALSKVTVKMRSSNTNLEVKVTNVAMAHLMTKGNFSFPRNSTAGTPTTDNIGKWADQNTPMTYMLHMSQSPSDIITLTETPTVVSMAGQTSDGSLFMMPQPLVWHNGGSDTDNYITVMCSIYDTKSGAKLWPNENTPAENIVEGSTFGDGLLKFPLSTSKFSEWQPGCHYIYNLVINSNDEMGAIEFGTPSVDTFIDVTTNYE